MSDYIPDEIFAEILKSLPPKSLLRFTSVQKSWYNLIRSPLFITTHLNYQKTHNKNCLLFNTTFDDGGSSLLSLRFDDPQCPEYYSLDRLEDRAIYPSSSGLICLCNDDKIYLWNPAIRKYKTLPDPPLFPDTGCIHWDNLLAVGFSSKVNDFKVVQIISHSKSSMDLKLLTDIQVYSLSTNSWKISRNNRITTNSDREFDGAFVNGTAFLWGETWEGKEIILSYDTHKDVLRKISVPEQSENIYYYYSLQECGESLALFGRNSDCFNVFNMWVLKEIGTNEEVCWEKRISVTLNVNIYFWPVAGLRNNGEVIVRKLDEYGLVSCNVKKNETKDFVHSRNLWPFDEFVQWNPNEDHPPGPPITTINPFVECLLLINEVQEE